MIELFSYSSNILKLQRCICCFFFSITKSVYHSGFMTMENRAFLTKIGVVSNFFWFFLYRIGMIDPVILWRGIVLSVSIAFQTEFLCLWFWLGFAAHCILCLCNVTIPTRRVFFPFSHNEKCNFW